MKFKFRTLSAALLALCTFAAAPPASAQVTATTIVQLTNIPPNLQAESISNSIASVIPLTRDSGLGLEWSFVSKAATSNVVAYIYRSVDGTNYDTVPWLWIVDATSTTAAIRTTNWSAASLRGYQTLMVGNMTNQNAGANGIVTNNYIRYNRPNP